MALNEYILLLSTVTSTCRWSPYPTWCGNTSVTTSSWRTTTSPSFRRRWFCSATWGLCCRPSAGRGRRTAAPTDQVTHLSARTDASARLCQRFDCPAVFQSSSWPRRTRRSCTISRSSVWRRTSTRKMISFTRGARRESDSRPTGTSPA